MNDTDFIIGYGDPTVPIPTNLRHGTKPYNLEVRGKKLNDIDSNSGLGSGDPMILIPIRVSILKSRRTLVFYKQLTFSDFWQV